MSNAPLFPDEAPSFLMRKPCANCGGTEGRIKESGAQDTVRCNGCDRFQYNAPRTETGKAVRSVTTVHNGIKPKQRARILARDGFRCVFCGATGELHVDHLIPVKQALDAGWTDDQINGDDNLVSACPECNIGRSSTLLPLRSVIALYMRRLKSDPEESGGSG